MWRTESTAPATPWQAVEQCRFTRHIVPDASLAATAAKSRPLNRRDDDAENTKSFEAQISRITPIQNARFSNLRNPRNLRLLSLHAVVPLVVTPMDFRYSAPAQRRIAWPTFVRLPRFVM